MAAGDKCPTHHDLLAYLVDPATNGNAQKIPAVTLVTTAGAAVTATAGLTDTQLRATPVPVSFTADESGLTDVQLRATAVPVSGPVTDAQLRATAVPVSLPTAPATGTLTSVNNSVTSVTVLASNAARKGATIYNDDTAAILKIKFGATASSTSFVYAIPAAGYFEVPFGYTGIIDGIASVATGAARVTELT